MVHLPEPADVFEAIVRVDSNRVTAFYSNAGRGSVIATVEIWGQEVFRSNTMCEGMVGVPLTVQLGGATESPESSTTQMNFKLRGLDPSSYYSIINMGIAAMAEMAGQDLREKGLLVSITEEPSAVLIVYERLR